MYFLAKTSLTHSGDNRDLSYLVKRAYSKFIFLANTIIIINTFVVGPVGKKIYLFIYYFRLFIY